MSIYTQLLIEHKDGILYLRNNSIYTLEILLVPIKPKKKIFPILIMKANTFVIVENAKDWKMSNHYFRFIDEAEIEDESKIKNMEKNNDI